MTFPVALPPSSALDPTQIFPTLTPQQIDRIRPWGKVRHVQAGEVLFQPGDGNVPFFVLLSGTLEITQPSQPGQPILVTHTAGNFAGEIATMSGQRAFVLGRVASEGDFLELQHEDFRTLIGRDAELSEIFLRAFILRRLAIIHSGAGNVILLGSRHSAATLHLREFLSRNGYPYVYRDLDTDASSQELLDRFNITPDQIPVTICNGHDILRNPTIQQLADCLGLNANVDQSAVRDLIIVGGGPSGLAAAVYAASEGLDALLLETATPGGQAGSSSKIENYLGFPTGISGQELTGRALTQAMKFGADIMVSRSAVRLACNRRPYKILLEDDTKLAARSVVIATGAAYNKPPLPNLAKFEGLGIYYGATFMEAQLCEGDDVIVVGGGNSAGQAAVFLSQSARKVHVLVRSGQLADTMSRYLIRRIEENPKIELHYRTEIIALEGDTQLERVAWKNKATGEESTHDIRHVFIMAGASPRSGWLQGCLALDGKGFVLTGRDIDNAALQEAGWSLTRPPQMLETSLPGVFAVGDVRSGNVKRVASAVGEGSMAISLVHRALAEL
ncbi:MAG: FAD-dependent oxidoreductase [Candidatus Korobacteraceae bacterium]